MDIIFSRHAKRRAKLYKIPESMVRDILSEIDLPDCEHEIVKNVNGLIYPLKLVVSVVNKTITVITSYPLKKEKK